MNKLLVAYTTNAGSTGEVAEAVAAALRQGGHTVDVMPIAAVASLDGYDAVVVGAPMIFGWHSASRRFVRRFRGALAGKRTAYFACAMRLTRVPGEPLSSVALALDPNLVSEPAKPGSLSLKERFTTLNYYMKPMMRVAPAVKPVSVAFFNGSLDMRRLKWWQAAFVMIVVQATPGDYRDWEFIKGWGKDLGELL